MVKRQVAVAAVSAALMLPLVAGCGPDKPTSTGSPAAPGAATNTGPGGAGESIKQQSIDMRRREENMIAACMKKAGFTYIPYVPPEMLNPPAPEPTDYPTLKALRSKYGFGDLFAPFVYPDDPNLLHSAPEDPDPNKKIVNGLDNTQAKAYLRAYDGDTYNDKKGDPKLTAGCVAEAVKAVDPRAWKHAVWRHELLVNPAKAQADFDKRCEANPACKNYDDGSAILNPLKDKYATCLKSKGYLPDYDVDKVARTSVSARYDKLNHGTDVFHPKIDQEVARVELRNEIKVALEDLECGKDYIAAKGRQEAKDAEQTVPYGGLP